MIAAAATPPPLKQKGGQVWEQRVAHVLSGMLHPLGGGGGVSPELRRLIESLSEVGRARRHRDRNELDLALAAIERALAATPNHAPAYTERGWLKFEKHDFDESRVGAERRLQPGCARSTIALRAFVSRACLLHRPLPVAKRASDSLSQLHGGESRAGAWAWTPGDVARGAALLIAVLLAYLPAWHGAFLWDDDFHVTRPALRTLEGLGQIWTDVMATQQYYPILHSAFWIEHRLFGDDPTGYHLVACGLHVLNALLLVAVLRCLRLRGAWLAAWIFALHPVMVESVAWVSELKNTLSTAFYLTALLAYWRADRRSGGWYLAALGIFLLALGTKTVTASLPGAILVLQWWRAGRLEWRRDVGPTLPFFVLGALAGRFTAYVEVELIGASGADFALGFGERVLLAGRVVWFYIGKLLWPAELMFNYPRWVITAGSVGAYAAVAALGVVLFAAWRRRTRSRGGLAALLLFGGTLFPVLGFFDIFPFQFSYVADHFQYLASLAILAPLAVGLTESAARLPAGYRGVAAVLALLALGALAQAQSRQYRDAETLYRATLARHPASWLAHQNLALILDARGAHAEATEHHRALVRLKPAHAPGRLNLGTSLARQGRLPEAMAELAEALRLQPDYPKALQNYGGALLVSGRPAEALPFLARAARRAPGAETHRVHALALSVVGRREEAVAEVERGLRLAPDDPELQRLLAQLR